MTLPSRFWEKTTPGAECVVWTGAVNSKGYPCFAVDGTSQLAHRLTASNLYIRPDDRSYECIECRRAQGRLRRAAQKAALSDSSAGSVGFHGPPVLGPPVEEAGGGVTSTLTSPPVQDT